MSLEEDVRMDLYCDVLVRYLLVDSAMGECDLGRHLSAALDSGDEGRLADAMRTFEGVPDEVKSRILEGDPTLETEMETSRRSGRDDAPVRARVRPASA